MTPEAQADAMPPLLRLAALERLKALFQAKRWSELEASLGDRPVWAFDRPLPPAEYVRLLARLFDSAEDLQLLVMGNRIRGRSADELRHTFHCCVVWGEAGSWKEHELELDLHLGSKPEGGGAWRVSYLGLSSR